MTWTHVCLEFACDAVRCPRLCAHSAFLDPIPSVLCLEPTVGRSLLERSRKGVRACSWALMRCEIIQGMRVCCHHSCAAGFAAVFEWFSLLSRRRSCHDFWARWSMSPVRYSHSQMFHGSPVNYSWYILACVCLLLFDLIVLYFPSGVTPLRCSPYRGPSNSLFRRVRN